MTRRVFALASAVLLGLSCTPAPVVSADECANVVPKAGEVWARQDYNFQGGKQDLSKLTCAPGYQFSCNGVAASPATDGDHGGCVDVNLCYHRNGTQFWYPNMALTIGSCIPIECPDVVPKAGEVWTRQQYNFQGGTKDLSKLTCSAGYTFSCNGSPATPAPDADHYGCSDAYLCYHHNSTSGSGGTTSWYPNMAIAIGSCVSTGAGTLHSINVDGSAVDMTASSSSSSSGVSAMAVGVTVGMLVFLVIASHVVRSYVARRQQQKQVNTIDCMTQQQQQV